jgi:hypothetical protein
MNKSRGIAPDFSQSVDHLFDSDPLNGILGIL